MARVYFYKQDPESSSPMRDLQTAIESIRKKVEIGKSIGLEQTTTGLTTAYLEFNTEVEAALFKLSKL